jgi:hypothetical protein
MGVYARLLDYENPSSLGYRLRNRRIALLRDLVTEIAERRGGVRIIDLGGTATYWGIFGLDRLRALNCRVHLVNMDEGGHDYRRSDDVFSHESGNACDLPGHADGSFDLVHSNSVIEHVGGWRDMARFAKEARRLAPAHYVQTPYYWFPVEPHFGTPFYHWLPEQLRAGLLRRMTLGHMRKAETLSAAMEQVQSCQLLDGRQMAELFPDSEIVRERVLGVTKSLIAIRRGAALH